MMDKEKEKSLEKKIIWGIVVVSCIVLFAFAISPKTLQNDTFYTIKIGEYIYNNGISNLTEDVFSWHDLPYTYPHWLYDLGVFIVYNIFGQAGIYASTIILASILGLVIYKLCARSGNKPVSLVATIGAMYLLEPYIAARAQLLTFILFGLTVFFIEKFLETHKKRYAVFLVIIPLIIANVHCAVFPFYFVLYLPYIAEFLWISFIDLDVDKRIQKLSVKGLLKICKNNFYFMFRYKGEEYKLPCKEILYFESAGKKIRVNLMNGDAEIFVGKLSDVAERLGNGKIPFLRIHQSYLVNYYWIRARSKTEVTLCNGTKLPISGERKKNFSFIYDMLLKEERNSSFNF